jgi:putative spermidine/putrescine transport system ATP-binding protein
MLNGTRLRTSRSLPPGDDLILVVRAEKLLPASRSASDVNLLPGRVREVVFQGESVAVFVELGQGQTVVMRHPTNQESLSALPAAGQETTLSLHPESTIVVPAPR